MPEMYLNVATLHVKSVFHLLSLPLVPPQLPDLGVSLDSSGNISETLACIYCVLLIQGPS